MKEFVAASLMLLVAALFNILLGTLIVYFAYNTIVSILLVNISSMGLIPTSITLKDALMLSVSVDLLKSFFSTSKIVKIAKDSAEVK
jgi:hypothetical protein